MSFLMSMAVVNPETSPLALESLSRSIARLSFFVSSSPSAASTLFSTASSFGVAFFLDGSRLTVSTTMAERTRCRKEGSFFSNHLKAFSTKN